MPMAASDGVPELVTRARAVAREIGFPLDRDEAGAGRPSASLPGVGAFLAVLAAGCSGGRIAEIGTGAGIGAAWLASAMPADCVLVTAEIDDRLAAAAGSLFAGDHRVRVIAGDAARVLPGEGPFDLLFADGPWRHPDGPGSLIGLLRPGGRLVMDDVTPLRLLPPDSPLRASDPKRDVFADPRLVSAEVVLPDLRNALLVGTRVA